MTQAANDAVPTIGPATERRIQMAFADTCLLTGKAASKLLGMDEKTLRALNAEGVITSVRRGGGATRAYTEGDIRTYLTQGEASTAEKQAKTAQRGGPKVVSFMERRRAKRG